MIRGKWIKFDEVNSKFDNSFVRNIRCINQIGGNLDDFARLLDHHENIDYSQLLKCAAKFVSNWNKLEVIVSKQTSVPVGDLRKDAEDQYFGV